MKKVSIPSSRVLWMSTWLLLLAQTVGTVESFIIVELFTTQSTCSTKLYALSKKQLKQAQEDLLESNQQFFAPQPTSYTVKKDNDVVHDNSSNQYNTCQYLTSNRWPRGKFGRILQKKHARKQLHGVEIRLLTADHPLAGQLGLFCAVRPFRPFDIVGEYCGQVYDGDRGGHYATHLEDSRNNPYASLGVDAAQEGNECRYINHYQGIAEQPNVVMKIAYVDELPRVMIVAKQEIAVGEELLLQYSDEYVQEYIQ